MSVSTVVIMVIMTLSMAYVIPEYATHNGIIVPEKNNIIIPEKNEVMLEKFETCNDVVYITNLNESIESYEQVKILQSFNNSVTIKNINNLTDKYNPVINVSEVPVWYFHNGIYVKGLVLSEKRIKEDLCS